MTIEQHTSTAARVFRLPLSAVGCVLFAFLRPSKGWRHRRQTSILCARPATSPRHSDFSRLSCCERGYGNNVLAVALRRPQRSARAPKHSVRHLQGFQLPSSGSRPVKNQPTRVPSQINICYRQQRLNRSDKSLFSNSVCLWSAAGGAA